MQFSILNYAAFCSRVYIMVSETKMCKKHKTYCLFSSTMLASYLTPRRIPGFTLQNSEYTCPFFLKYDHWKGQLSLFPAQVIWLQALVAVQKCKLPKTRSCKAGLDCFWGEKPLLWHRVYIQLNIFEQRILWNVAIILMA